MLVLVRHGEATANADGRLLGRADVPLTERGRSEVEALRPHLGSVSAVISSPLRRAVDTAEGLGTGCPVVIDDRWVELDYGEHEGHQPGALPAEIWRTWRGDPSYRPPGGESLADVASRVHEACEELFARAGTGARDERGDVVVVSHVSPIKAAVAWALGATEDTSWRMHLSTGSITRIGWGAGGTPLVYSYNWLPIWTPPRRASAPDGAGSTGTRAGTPGSGASGRAGRSASSS